jgi:hypothetical protein
MLFLFALGLLWQFAKSLLANPQPAKHPAHKIEQNERIPAPFCCGMFIDYREVSPSKESG